MGIASSLSICLSFLPSIGWHAEGNTLGPLNTFVKMINALTFNLAA